MTDLDFSHVEDGLKDFQKATVSRVFERFYGEGSTRRFLVADEVGLGKTLVARGVIARAIEHLKPDIERLKRIDIVYVCSNAEIARQNLRRLTGTQDVDFALAERITLLPLRLKNLTGTDTAPRWLNFVSFTPNTSLDLKNRAGTAQERALLHRMLGEAWGHRVMRTKGARNFMRATSGLKGFTYWTDWVAGEDLDPTLTARFIETLATQPELRERFDALTPAFRRDRPNQEARSARIAWIGELRRLLARSCVTALEPDLIILDEFQRFKRLLDGDDDAAELARLLFDYPDARVLLLSATPYKMYTLADEPDDDHYADFLATLRFLVSGDTEEMRHFERELGAYRRAILRIAEDGEAPAMDARDALQTRLRAVMTRTERLALTADRGGMLKTKSCPGVRLEPDDLRAYVDAAALSADLDTGDMVEYWKSIPYPVNFLDGYALGRALDTARVNGTAHNLPRVGLLPWKHIEDYRRIDPQNPRLRSLASQTVDEGMWQLLWLPPTLPYYRTEKPFASDSAALLTKKLVFSAWNAVPRAIATLTSYSAEREMIRSNARQKINTPAARKRFRSLLALTVAEERPTGMPVFALLYPSVSLARLADPLEIARGLGGSDGAPPLREVRRAAEARVADALAPWLSNAPTDGPVDERWCWAAPLLLDGVEGTAWLGEPGAAESWRGDIDSGDRARDESGWSTHVRLAAGFLETEVLGTPPADLVSVVAELALAAPGTAALRALYRVCDEAVPTEDLRPQAAHMAWSFRTLFGTPEATEMVKGLMLRDPGLPYWRQVLAYCLNGGLQAVLDEYVYVLVEYLGLLDRRDQRFADALAAEVSSAASTRTPVYSVRDMRSGADGAPLEPHSMRAHFAVRLGDERQEDGRTDRPGAVRRAFNSPFWPFVLASTSVGQEGLDFHLYCHAVVHWNLPSNPVDLEQREGRVHRYKNHAVRKNVASLHRGAAFGGERDPWGAMFRAGDDARQPHESEMIPNWILPLAGGASIERYVPALPYSRDAARMEDLSRSLAAYRLAFGQPRQEDLVAYLRERISPDELSKLSSRLGIDLSPPRLEST